MKVPDPKQLSAFIKQFTTGIRAHPLVRRLSDWTKQLILPGFQGVPLYDVAWFFYQETQKDTLMVRAGSLAFHFMLALFPSIIFLFTLLPYLPIPNLDRMIFNFLYEIMPENAYAFMFDTIDNLVNIQRGGLLSLGFLLAIFFSSNGVLSMMRAFNKSYQSAFRKRNIFQKRIVAIQITMVLATLLMFSIAFIIAGNKLLYWILEITHANHVFYQTIVLVKWLAILLLVYSSISAIYRYCPATLKKFSFFSAGTSLATLISIMTSIGFSFFVNNFGRFNEFYGSIGTLIVLMIWIQLNSLSLLIGFELNVSIAMNRSLLDERNSADELSEEKKLTARDERSAGGDK